MATKPTILPRWATNDVVNPISSQNNVVEPATAIKNLGWDFKQKPPRQYFNWLQRYNYQWAKYVDDTIDQELKVGSSPAFVSLNLTTGFSVATDKFTVDNTGITGIAGQLNLAKDLVIAGDKFVVTYSSGELNTKGNIKVTTNKFVVTASSGNVATKGTINSLDDLSVGTSGGLFLVDVSEEITKVKSTLEIGGLAGAGQGKISIRNSAAQVFAEIDATIGRMRIKDVADKTWIYIDSDGTFNTSETGSETYGEQAVIINKDGIDVRKSGNTMFAFKTSDLFPNFVQTVMAGAEQTTFTKYIQFLISGVNYHIPVYD